MVCSSCIFRSTRHAVTLSLLPAPSRSFLLPATVRSLSTQPYLRNAATTALHSTTDALSAPPQPSPTKLPSIKTSSASRPAHPPSSCPAGTPLKGLGYIKNRADPIAAEDASYPSWLWDCLSDSHSKRSSGRDAAGATGTSSTTSGDDEGDLFSKSKKQRRVAAKRLRKLAALHPEGLAPKIPLEQQSIDLPRNEEGTVEGALAAGEARDEITRRLRIKRRGEIKTSNFLKGMR